MGRGNISIGNIDGDSIADIGITGNQTYQIGLGKIENEQLGFDMQPVQFKHDGQFFFDGNGYMDFIVSDNSQTGIFQNHCLY